MKVQTCTGSESHTTEWRSVMVTVNGQPIYKVLKPLSQSWEEVGNKGRHGKWCVAEYLIPDGYHVVFTAKANGRETIVEEFIARSDLPVNVDGYPYGGEQRGWIVSI